MGDLNINVGLLEWLDGIFWEVPPLHLTIGTCRQLVLKNSWVRRVREIPLLVMAKPSSELDIIRHSESLLGM